MFLLMAFNIRVYGLCLDLQQKLLVVDEFRGGYRFTKFPGGGLEQGEGTIECLKREFKEETGQEIKIKSHFYTTDFYQPSFFNQHDQIISIYYLIDSEVLNNIDISHQKHAYHDEEEEPVSFRLVDLKTVDEDEFKFPIDKVVLKKLKNTVK